MTFRSLILLVFFLVATPVWARDIYVNNVTGEDRNDGSASEVLGADVGPVRTITRALQLARKADRVIVSNTGEAYHESITLQGGRQSGVPDAPFELVGNGAMLDGTAQVPTEGWSHYQGKVFRYRPPKMSFQLLYLDAKPAERRKVARREEIAGLQPLQWCIFEGYLYFCVEEDRLPQSYKVAYTDLQVGITLYEVRHVVIRDLVVQGFQLDGVNAFDGVMHATLTGLNCRGNARSGISIGGASRVLVESCLVGNNGAAQVRSEGVAHTQLIRCDLLDNTAPKIVRDGGEVTVSQ